VAIDRHGPPFDPETGHRVISERGLWEARAVLRKHFPALKNAPLVESRVCQYENTSNGDFLIDRHPDAENVWLIGGGSGHGFKHGPAVAEYLLRQLEGRAKNEPRFSLTAKSTRFLRTVY
jgi:glycine/D-amino acid oxidase-like deaminating enzyme